MEHRRGQRRTVSLQVSLKARGLQDAEGRVVDMSLGGAFIRLRGALPSTNSIVELDFGPQGTEETAYHCRALVIRCDGDGVGVMFDRRQDPRLLHSFSTDQVLAADGAHYMRGQTGISLPANAGR